MYYTNVARRGDEILLRAIKNGKPVKIKDRYHPTLFVTGTPKTETPYKDIYNNPCIPIKFDSIKEANDWAKQQQDISNISVLGMNNFILAYIADNFSDIDYDISKIRTFIIDIEVHADKFPSPLEAKYPIDAITVYDSVTDSYVSFGLKPWSKKKSELDPAIVDNVTYNEQPNEKALLADFLLYWNAYCPDIVSGWNSDGFDLPYIYNRLCNVLGPTSAKKLSPWEIVNAKTVKDKFMNEALEVDIVGVASLDYMKLYEKFTYVKRAFMNLDYISFVELGEKKLELGMTHYELSNQNYQKYIDYNIKDAWLVKQLDEKLKLITLAIGMAYDSKINFSDVYSPVKMWDAIIFNKLKEQKVVIPKMSSHVKQTFEGAYVKDPVPGFYRWVISFDLTSLYPMLLNQYNISPETILGRANHVDILQYINKTATGIDTRVSNAANGMQYTKDFKGVIPTVALEVFENRKKYKKQMLEYKRLAIAEPDKKEYYSRQATIYDVKQMAAKIAINSLYGALGNVYFRYYDLCNAEAVTVSGQLAIRWIERKLNEYLSSLCGSVKDRCIAIDTDSVYFTFDDLVEQHLTGKSTEQIVDALDKLVKAKIEPFIAKSYEELAEYMSAYENRMHMKREAIADTAFWTAKKRYALNVWDLEEVRYKEPKLKIMGLETQKSSTPTFVQDALEESIRIILQEDNDKLLQFIHEFETEYMKTDYRMISSISAVNNIKKYSDQHGNPIKGAPMNVKATLAYNKLGYGTIRDGEKVGIIQLKRPNKFNSDVIAYPAEGLPDEIKDYVISKMDCTSLFDKVYRTPLCLITTAINWKHEDSNDLMSFF